MLRYRMGFGCSCLFVLALLAYTRGQPSSGAPQLLLQGRFYPGAQSAGIASLPQTFSWPASSAFVTFQGSSITASINAVAQIANATYSVNWFRFYIDGEAIVDGFTSYNNLNLTITISAPDSGTHTLQITKVNEAQQGEAILQDLTLDQGGTFLPPETPSSLASGRRILVFGDSYAVGFGVGGVDNTTCAPTAATLEPDWVTACNALKVVRATECASLWKDFQENAVLAFGPLTAQALNADFQLLASSGSGLTGYAFSEDENPGFPLAIIQSLNPSNALEFNRSVFAGPTATWPVSSWIPQVIVVAGGSNDLRGDGLDPNYTLDQWVQQTLSFLQMLSKDFNKPTIILQVYPAWLPNVTAGRDGFNQTQQYEQGMSQLYAAAQSAGLPNIQLMEVSNLGPAAYANWCGDHPSAQAQAAIAQQLSTFISSVHPGWAVNGTINPDPSLSEIRPSTMIYTGSTGTGSAPPMAAAPVSVSSFSTDATSPAASTG